MVTLGRAYLCVFSTAGDSLSSGQLLEDNAAPQGLADGLGFRMDVQLLVNAADVIADSVDADV